MKKTVFFIFLSTILIIPIFADAMIILNNCTMNTGGPNPFSAYCTGSAKGNVITWKLQNACFGKAPLTYLWSGDSNINGNTNSSVTATYPENGTYTATITVKDSSQNTATATCSATVSTITSPISIPTPSLTT